MSDSFQRVLLLIGFVLMGFAIGVTGAFIQAQRWVLSIGDFIIVIPWGTAVILIAIVVVTRLATVAVGTRWAGWLFFSGWLAFTVILAAETSSGDLAISSGARQMVYLFGGIVLGTATATLPAAFRIRKGTKRGSQASVLFEP
ncbi:MAG: DUF6113 family protein [Candidatus Nanopelagicales bacterium]